MILGQQRGGEQSLEVPGVSYSKDKDGKRRLQSTIPGGAAEAPAEGCPGLASLLELWFLSWLSLEPPVPPG